MSLNLFKNCDSLSSCKVVYDAHVSVHAWLLSLLNDTFHYQQYNLFNFKMIKKLTSCFVFGLPPNIPPVRHDFIRSHKGHLIWRCSLSLLNNLCLTIAVRSKGPITAELLWTAFYTSFMTPLDSSRIFGTRHNHKLEFSNGRLSWSLKGGYETCHSCCLWKSSPAMWFSYGLSTEPKVKSFSPVHQFIQLPCFEL